MAVCLVDCIYERESMVVIHPDEFIDCGVCEPECPVDAIKPDSDISQKWIKLNPEYVEIWPNIARKKAAPVDADDRRDKPNKIDFSWLIRGRSKAYASVLAGCFKYDAA